MLKRSELDTRSTPSLTSGGQTGLGQEGALAVRQTKIPLTTVA